MRDAIGRYDGDEVDLSYRLPIRLGRWTLTPWASVLWQDARLTGYYYGVSEEEATAGRPAYTPGAARNLAVGVNTAWHVNERFFMFANVGVEKYDDVIANSPIIDSSTNARMLAGAAWTFGGDPPPKRVRGEDYTGPPLWSWRVHWGYQLKHNIFPVAMAGYWTKSVKVPDTLPTQTGFTLGRKLSDQLPAFCSTHSSTRPGSCSTWKSPTISPSTGSFRGKASKTVSWVPSLPIAPACTVAPNSSAASPAEPTGGDSTWSA